MKTIALLLMLLPGLASAHHEMDHRKFSINVPSEVPILVFACFDHQVLVDIVTDHKEKGYEVANKAIETMPPGICGMVVDHITIVAVHWSGTLDWPDGTSRLGLVVSAVGMQTGFMGGMFLSDAEVVPEAELYAIVL